MQRIRCHDLALERDQAEHFERRLQFASVIGGHCGQRQAQARRVGRDHHPGPRALPRILALVARAAQRLAINGDHIAHSEEGCDLCQHPPKGRIQCLRIDHPEHRREGVVRRDRMLELQEASENMLFCPTEVRHLGTTGCPAEPCCKAHDQEFAKLVTRVAGSGIGDVIESGEENVHAGNGLQKGDPRPRIHPHVNRKTPQIRSNPKRDSPGFGHDASLRSVAAEGLGRANPASHLNRDHRHDGVTTLKCASAHVPRFLTGSKPPIS